MTSSNQLPAYVAAETAKDWLAALSNVAEVFTYKTLSYDLLHLQPGQTVLDIGCGIGDDTRALADRVAPGGSAVGVDADTEMIERARERQRSQDGIAIQPEFLVAPAEHLPLEKNRFDGARMDRVLQHVANPAHALREILRVLKPGGRVSLVEPDWKTMAVYPGSPIGSGDDHTFAAITAWQVAHTPHPLIGRQLRALLQECGFAQIDVRVIAYSSTSCQLADLVMELSHVARAVASEEYSSVTQSEANAWIAATQQAEAENRFFAVLPLFFATAVKA